MSQSATTAGEDDGNYRRWLKRGGLYAVLGGMVVFYLIPIETGLATALTPPDAYTGDAPFLPPLPADMTL